MSERKASPRLPCLQASLRGGILLVGCWESTERWEAGVLGQVEVAKLEEGCWQRVRLKDWAINCGALLLLPRNGLTGITLWKIELIGKAAASTIGICYMF